MKKILIITAMVIISTSIFAGLWDRPIVKRVQKDMARIERLAREVNDLVEIPDDFVVADSIVYELSPEQKAMFRQVAIEKFLKIRAIVDSICIDYGIE